MDRTGAHAAPPTTPATRAPMPQRAKRPRRTGADRAASVLLYILGAAGLGLSSWSITTLLRDQANAPTWASVLGVGVFDGVAIVAGLLVFLRRAAPAQALGARVVMMGALTLSTIVNAAHGVSLGGWPIAVILGAAPVAFEVAFELRHRSLTLLVWLLFPGHTWDALRRDAWARIAPAVTDAENADGYAVHLDRTDTAPAAPVAPTAVRGRSRATLDQARSMLALARDTAVSDPDTQIWRAAADAADRAVTVAHTDGWSLGDIYEADTAALLAASADVRRASPRRPQKAEMMQVSASDMSGSRPADVPTPPASDEDGPDEADDDERVPDQRPPSIAAAVRHLAQQGFSNPDWIAETLTHTRGQTVDRDYVRKVLSRPGRPGTGAGTGLYI